MTDQQTDTNCHREVTISLKIGYKIEEQSKHQFTQLTKKVCELLVLEDLVRAGVRLTGALELPALLPSRAKQQER